MNLGAFFGGFLDPYERTARLFPALLVVMPLLVPVVLVLGTKHAAVSAVMALVGGCGVVYGIGSIARGKGIAVEERLVEKWGGMPTTLMLRHRDKTLERSSKAAYHELFRSKLGIELPTKLEEEADAEAADDAYKGAVRRLREATRGKPHRLLLKENIAYGFHRNMRGLRGWGWMSSSLAVLFGVLMTHSFTLEPLTFHLNALADMPVAAWLTLGVAAPFWVGWFYFDDSAVRRIANVYAERLFESLRALPKYQRRATEK